jgi:hypothetical protein
MRKYIFAYESEIIRGNAEARAGSRNRAHATGNGQLKKMALAASAFVNCCRSRRTGARAKTMMKPLFKQPG